MWPWPAVCSFTKRRGSGGEISLNRSSAARVDVSLTDLRGCAKEKSVFILGWLAYGGAMKFSISILAAAAMLATGCGEKSKTSQAVNEVSNVVTAPVNYLGAVVQAQKYSEKQIDLAYVNQAIQQFQAGEGRLPKDLNELVEMHYLGKVPAAPFGYKIVYDATAGSIKVVKQ